MRNLLVFGASGAVGRHLLPALAPGYGVKPVSRTPAPGWLLADLRDNAVAWPDCDGVISLGPLDAFAEWMCRSPIPSLRRVLAFSSMSADSKRASADERERVLADTLRRSEDALREIAAPRAIALTIFRPTLIYGAGVDRSLAPIARFMRRWHAAPFPLGACGLRQPVHAADLALACSAALENTATFGKTYELGGGERLTFAAILARLRASAGTFTVPLPVPIVLLRVASALSGSAMFGRGAIDRLNTSLVADNSAAVADFGYAPRPFIAADVLPVSRAPAI